MAGSKDGRNFGSGWGTRRRAERINAAAKMAKGYYAIISNQQQWSSKGAGQPEYMEDARRRGTGWTRIASTFFEVEQKRTQWTKGSQLATSSRKGVLDYLALILRIAESQYLHASEQASSIPMDESVPESTGGLARGSSATRTCIANLPPTTSTH